MTKKISKNYPKNIFQSALLIALIILVSFSFTIFFNSFINFNSQLYLDFWFMLRDSFSYLLSFILIHLICKRKISGYKFYFKNCKIIPLIILVGIMLDLGIGLPLYHIIPKPFFLKPDLAAELPGLNIIIGSLIIAPFFEELIMRGIILDGLLKNVRYEIAIIISAILFAIIHLSIDKIPLLLLSGLYLGWIYYKTKSLLITIIVHFFNNLISIYELYFFIDLRVDKDGIQLIYGDNTILLIVIFNLILFISFYLLKMKLKNKCFPC